MPNFASDIVNAMSVDVEDYFHVAALAQSIDRSTWNDREYRAEENTRRLLDLFEASNMKSTFFVLGWVAKRSPQLIREIHDRGHEVASHGMSHLLVYNQTPQEFASETIESKKLLEDITGAVATHFCYPSGEYRPHQKAWLRELGVASATTTRHGLSYPGMDAMELPRFLDSDAHAPELFDAALTGLLAILREPAAALRR